MKPLRLTVEGFTSFRERLEIDFSGLDLFAITGPTGAGKSSLIDAIVFALYGQVPRVGDDYKQLISHGVERLSVLFEFAVGGERYRIARAVRRERPSQQRLERLTPAGSEPLADKAREIRAEVERILGLDYDGFTRSVVLPQGQFDAFLKGEPKERRKILVALLGLGVYERMQQLANQRGASARAESEFLRKQIETDFAGATPEELERSREERRGSEAEAARAEADLVQLGAAAPYAHAVRAARRELATLAATEVAEATALAAAQMTLDGAGRKTAELASELERLRGQLESLGIDDARHALLTAAKPRADQLVALTPRVARLAADVVVRQKAVAEAQADLAAAEAALPDREQEEEAAREQETTARAAREAAHRQHLAVTLRRGLRPGEACPVCARALTSVLPADEPALDAADAALRAAEKTRQAAGERRQKQRLLLAQRQAAAEGLGRELVQLEERLRDTRALAGDAVTELLESGFLPIETTDPEALAARIQSEQRQLTDARRQQADLDKARRSAEQEQAHLAAAVAGATARRDGARARLDEIAAKKGEQVARLEEASRELIALAGAAGWAGLQPPPAGRDEVAVVESLRVAAQDVSRAAAARLATARQTVERVEKAILRAEELRGRRQELEARASLHKTLADHLKANEIVAWIQEEALSRLAAGGSRHLSQLSQGRYQLRLGAGDDTPATRAEQDFYVSDHWNVDSVRSVRTLSGGETFLASLGLALALAESLAELSAGGRATEALESLFLDEGFGTLDTETLDAVVNALDALHGGRRLVGIVTHVRDLAERLPARIEVRRESSASTAVVV